MSTTTCDREAAVVQAVLNQQWPDGCDTELRQHAEQCDVCREVVEVAALLREDFVATRDLIARRDVPLPSAGQIWWRAAVRARAEAAQTATRPLVWGYGLAAACAVGLLIGALTMYWPSLLPAVDRVTSLTWWVPPAAASAADALKAMLKAQLPLVVGVTALLIAMPVALYLALRED